MSSGSSGFVLLLGSLVGATVLTAGSRADAPMAVEDGRVPAPRGGFSTRAKQVGERDGKIAVMVELVDAPGAKAYASEIEASRKLGALAAAERATRVARAQIDRIDRAQRSLLASLTGGAIGGKVLYRVQRVYNGIALRVDAAQLDEIRGLPSVKAVHRLVPKYRTNDTSVPFINAPSVWTAGSGNTGKGIRIGVIDTGIDYLHSDFGGPGTGYSGNDPTVAGDVPNFPGDKIAGGYDFVGDDYDPSSNDPAVWLPHPDPDPMDPEGHGTHVSGTIAGFGVLADGSTFTGPYDATTPFGTLRIGPGVAPEATLYALKVFGKAGATEVVLPAIEWAVDPDGDSDFSDHLAVINLSLGSPYSSPDDPDMQGSDNAALAGVLSVWAAGNWGDSYYIAGGHSPRSIVAAASVDSTDIFDGFRVNAPTAIAGEYVASCSQDFDWRGMATPVTGTLVYPAKQSSGCGEFDAEDAALINGNVVLLDLAEGKCGSKARAENAAAAGAIGVIFVSPSPAIDYSIAGSPLIPTVLTTSTVGQLLKDNIAAGVNVTLTKDLINSQKIVDASRNDTLAAYSSRGPRLWDSTLKPDITAPGETIFSALAGTGCDGASFSGTSMAAPMITGSVTLLRQLHPDWTVEEIKALAMNTATHDLFAGPDSTPPVYSPARVGAGRIDLGNASEAGAVAYCAEEPGAVSVSFGTVEILGSLARTKNVAVVNKSGTPATYNVAYVSYADVPGVDYVFLGGNTVTVPANGSATFGVTLTANAAQLKHTRDASVSGTQGGAQRCWLSEESGYIVLTPHTGPALRVPVYAAVRPASDMAATQTSIALSSPTGTAKLDLSGLGFSQGNNPPDDEKSLLSVFELQQILPGPSEHYNSRGTDLKYVGVASDYKARVAKGGGIRDTVVEFAIATFGDWSSPNEVDCEVHIDSDQDGRFDHVVQEGYIEGPDGYSDAFVVWPCPTDGGKCGTAFYLNGASGSWYNTVPFNNNVVFLPVLASDIGLEDGSSRFTYYVRILSWDPYHGEIHSVQSDLLTYDPAHPGLDLYGTTELPSFYEDKDEATVPIEYNRSDYVASTSQGILLLHHNNAAGKRDQIVYITGPADLGVELVSYHDPPIYAGEAVMYLAQVTNYGHLGASGVTLEITLPPDATVLRYSTPQGTVSVAAGKLTCNLGTLPNGNGTYVFFALRLTEGGVHTFTATVKSDETDPNSANNSRIVRTTVIPVVDLSLTKQASPDPVDVGSELTYSLTVENSGPSVATGVTLTDTLPQGVTFVSVAASQGTAEHTGGVVTADLGTLAPGERAIVTIVVIPNAGGTLTNQATVASAEEDSSPEDNSTTLETTANLLADLSISKGDTPDPVVLKTNLTYEITVRNSGPSDATGVTVTDDLPGSVRYVLASASQGTVTEAGGRITANIGTLVVGASATVAILVVPLNPGKVSNTATVTGNEADPNPANNSASQITMVSSRPGPDLTAYGLVATQKCTGIGQKAKCSLRAAFTVINNGSKQAGASTVRIYLSPDADLSRRDRLLREIAVRSLAPGRTAAFNLRILLPKGTDADGSYLIIVADAAHEVEEMDETNNTLVSAPIH